MQLLLRTWPGISAWLDRLVRRRGTGRDAAPSGHSHFSLLSVVRSRRGGRYMAVDQIVGERAQCAWIDAGLKRTAWYDLADLEVVPALGPEDERWREAFRAGDHRKVG